MLQHCPKCGHHHSVCQSPATHQPSESTSVNSTGQSEPGTNQEQSCCCEKASQDDDPAEPPEDPHSLIGPYGQSDCCDPHPHPKTPLTNYPSEIPSSQNQSQHSHQPGGCCGHDHSPNEISSSQNQSQHSHQPGGCCGHDHNTNYDPTDFNGIPTTCLGQAVYRIDNMDCPMEESLIRGKLAGMAGITDLEFNLLKRILTVHHTLEALDTVEAALHSIGMTPEPIIAGQPCPDQAAPAIPWRRLLLAGALALGAEVGHYTQAEPSIVISLALMAILVGGLSTYKKGWIAAKNLNFNMNALMSFAVTGAMIIGQWPEAAMVMVLFNLAEAIEGKSLARARDAISGLLKLTPEAATVKQPNGSWLKTDATAVSLGAVVRVRPGERIALDGHLISGSSTINQAAITGESLPVEKIPGDQVFAGTLNESGSFEYRVSSSFTNSTISRIIRAVEEAQTTRAPIQRLVDRFARIYTPIVIVLALLVSILPPLFMGGTSMEWAYRGLVLLVIACPCALVISTPVTIVSALTAATRHGLLIKGGAFLEEGRKLTHIMLDKTGTITTGRPIQTDIVPISGYDEAFGHLIAVSLSSRSDHPVSRAIVEASPKNNSKALETLEVTDFRSLPGQGISGRIDGQLWLLGNHTLIHQSGYCSPELERRIDFMESQGKSVVGVMSEQGVCLLLAVADTIKDGSPQAIAQLKQMGLKTIMLTGDNQKTAHTVGQKAAVDEIRGELMPEDKLAAVSEIAEQGYRVGMVGDGINDAPALAKSHIGFAMGTAGTDTAIETADVAIMDDDLGKLATFIRLSKDTHTVLMQNIILAISTKLIFFILTFMGLTTLWMAVFADIGVSLLVVFNGLRMLRK